MKTPKKERKNEKSFPVSDVFIEKPQERKKERKIISCFGCVHSYMLRVYHQWICVSFYSSFVLYVHAYDFKFKVHCGSALRPDASELPYYFSPVLCVPGVGGLAYQTKNQEPIEFKAWYSPKRHHLWVLIGS